MKFTPTPYEVRELLEQVHEGRLALPEFQRNFIWRPSAVADFMRTVARNWPGGSFLLLEGPQEFAYKPIEGAPGLSKQPELLILDGQQRMTALYQALTDQADETYVVELGKVIAAEQFEDEHLRFEKKASFAKKYTSLEKMAADGIVPVHVIRDDTQFLRWTKFLDDKQQERAFAARDQHLSGFKSYFVPAVALPKNVPLSALAKIFETINRTGVRLDAFDLMVAKLYPKEFNLREQWDAARAEHEPLQFFRTSGIEVLKVVAIEEHLRQKNAGEKLTVKGVRESDILSVNSDTVISRWKWAVDAYVAALKFLRTQCGASSPVLVPSETMVLPLALAIGASGGTRAGFEDDLRRWFWCATFAQTYAQGANTQAVSDARALNAWRVDPAAVPEVVSGFKLDIFVLQDKRRRNEMFVRGIACLLAKRNARDWIANKELAQISEDLDYHHIFARKYLKNMGIDDADIVANITALRTATNQSLRNDSPDVVLSRKDIVGSAIESHAISSDVMASGKWNEFLEDRSKRLAALISETVAKPV